MDVGARVLVGEVVVGALPDDVAAATVIVAVPGVAGAVAVAEAIAALGERIEDDIGAAGFGRGGVCLNEGELVAAVASGGHVTAPMPGLPSDVGASVRESSVILYVPIHALESLAKMETRTCGLVLAAHSGAGKRQLGLHHIVAFNADKVFVGPLPRWRVERSDVGGNVEERHVWASCCRFPAQDLRSPGRPRRESFFARREMCRQRCRLQKQGQPTVIPQRMSSDLFEH